jgi:hypothetical protein
VHVRLTILDHASGNLGRHLSLGHFMLRQMFSSKAGAINIVRVGVTVIHCRDSLDGIKFAGSQGNDLMVLLDTCEMNHICGVGRKEEGEKEIEKSEAAESGNRGI